MTRISTFCAVSSALAVLALSADGASAATLVPATPKPVVPKVSAPQPKLYGKDVATGVTGRPPKTKSYKGYVEISSFSGVTRQSTIGSATGGAGSGKASLGELQINKVKGKSKINNGIILNSLPPSH